MTEEEFKKTPEYRKTLQGAGEEMSRNMIALRDEIVHMVIKKWYVFVAITLVLVALARYFKL